MNSEIKTRIEQTKQFVKKHPTLVACSLTAVVTFKITRDATINSAIRSMTEQAYTWGNNHGVVELQRDVLLAFVNDKGLDDEVREYIASL